MSAVTWQLAVGESDITARVGGYPWSLSFCLCDYPLYISRRGCLGHHVPGHSTGLTSLLPFHAYLYRTSFQSWKVPLQEPWRVRGCIHQLHSCSQRHTPNRERAVSVQKTRRQKNTCESQLLALLLCLQRSSSPLKTFPTPSPLQAL